MYNPDNYLTQVANCFLFNCRDSAVFIFPTLLADFKDPLQNLNNVHTLWEGLQMANTFIRNLFYFEQQSFVIKNPYFKTKEILKKTYFQFRKIIVNVRGIP